MITEHDSRTGIVKTYWQAIRERVEKVEPIFTKIVDQLNPDKTFPLYLVYLPYGSKKGDTLSSYLPDGKGQYYRLSDQSAPKEIIKNLGYGIDGSPMGMVLEKSLEYFIDLKDKKITIPWHIYFPGQVFPMSTILGCKSDRVYTPNGFLTVTSGARSVFMLPNVGCNTHHANLQRVFNIKKSAPKLLYDHWYIFKEIIDSTVYECHWNTCLIYFSEKWVSQLHKDTSWSSLKLYLYEKAWRKFEYERNRVYYDIAFSLIQEKRNLKPNPYLMDTARHLFSIALGISPGYVPVTDDELLPSYLIQKAYTESYGLKKYLSIIMQPSHFNFEKDKSPIYYSLQNPSTHTFSPKSREVSSTLAEMRELERIMSIFCEEFARDSGLCSDTIFSEISKNISLNYYHNKVDRHHIVSSSAKIIEADPRFQQTAIENNILSKFACDSTFVRGCVSISSI